MYLLDCSIYSSQLQLSLSSTTSGSIVHTLLNVVSVLDTVTCCVCVTVYGMLISYCKLNHSHQKFQVVENIEMAYLTMFPTFDNG